MQENDWRSLGRDIRDIVQDAVDTKNFHTLNQTLRTVLEQTAGAVGDGIRNAGEAIEKNVNQRRSTGPANPKRMGGNQTFQTSRENAQPPSRLFASTYGDRAGGMAMKVIGIIFGLTCGIAVAVLLLIALASGVFSFGLRLAVYILAPCLLAFLVLGGKGSSMRRMAMRFQEYVRCLHGRTYCQLEELAAAVDQSVRFVRKDLKKMIEKRWFPQGHLDRQETCLIVDEPTYRQYLTMMKEQERKAKQKPEITVEKQEPDSKLAPEVREIMEEGRAYLAEIRRCNQAIPGEIISAKISRMEVLVERILVQVEKNPEDVADIRKLMEYYLPTTVKLLQAYEELSAQPVQGENILSSKKEIEGTLDTLNAAFLKLLDSLFQDTAWDVSTDITVLKTMLAQEGLTEDVFSKKTAPEEKGTTT